MQNYTTSNAADSFESLQVSDTLDGSSDFGSSDLTASTAATSSTTRADEGSSDVGGGVRAAMSNSPVQTVDLAESVTSHSQKFVAKKVFAAKCIEEPVRTSEHKITTWQPLFAVQEGSEGSLHEIIQRADLVRAPWNATPLPTGSSPYGTTDELFNLIQQAIGGLACLPMQVSALLAHWTLSTWFSDGLSLAPGLSIIAPEFEGDVILRTLANFCRFPMILTRADITSLSRANWNTTPTLLFYDPTISKKMVSTLGCSSSRGYVVNDGSGLKDIYGPKAIYLGEEVSIDRIPHCSLQVRLQPGAPAPAAQHWVRPTKAVVENLQNQLLRYRTKNLVHVYNSVFDAPMLTSDTRAIANALGACIIDSPRLQAQLVALLTPVESQRQSERSTSLEAITIEATLNLVHTGKAQMLVQEIAHEFNRIAQARGERLHRNAETIGHRIKKLGLSTRRLGRAGRGLVIDVATNALIHELAILYCVAGLEHDDSNLQCPWCSQMKDLYR